ncbi:tyrosine-type recombinase/integrase [Pseudoxanthomonas winnipegensis]|uniref:Site-specific integrase n=1 Tax=Pseudoxanthomonas winnipegensis TaxID=2480810 RepID=A0A4Q8LEY8_9GAMM|nr:site-specific integrase [Pseudoxanthomonas winnipegensis]RZZ88915.1 site-specific integrase [Pseudoxanthomonas winnipegensis]TAA27376.1 site-specific integrase [Pseudoxanthomonas winnipegensis]TBV75662.1 site-specific integrase [Pseudoxanthomonas winnipegensis]
MAETRAVPKKAKEMTAYQVGRLPAGMHAAGGATGLYLRVSEAGARNWILRAVVGNRRRDMGLGGWPDVPLTEARDRARMARRKIEEGIDPIEQRRSAKGLLKSTPTFRWCAEQTIIAKRPEWKSAKHAEQWTNTLTADAYPIIGKVPVDQLELSHMLDVLTPIWTTKTESATRLRARMESVIAWATASGYRRGDNPARWRGNLDAVLPKPGKVAKVTHHKALPIDAVHGFVTDLRTREGIAARALEFVILTATRSGEVRGATWDEIDLDGATWTVPAERMKAGKEHRVPLSARAVALLESLPRMAGSDYVFAAPRGGMLSDMTISAVMRRMEVDAVPHGFRSTFRDWCSERTAYPRDVAEMALAHAITNKVEAAYRRGDLFAKRANMMSDWAKFIDTPPLSADVLQLRRAEA